MTTARLPIALLCASALAACTVAPAPSGPSLAALPGNGKTPAQFAYDDGACRAQANAANSGITPGQAAGTSAAGTVAATTLVGAGAGALIGAAARSAGTGAAAGAGFGLLMGLLTAGHNARASGAAFQRNYDVVYFQCMAATGNRVPTVFAAGPPLVAYPPPPHGPYPPPYPYYAPPPVVVAPAPVVVVP
ncbi:MAG TPA: glycine zipper family protein [Acidisphaera sp.]|nr:glycine zipper family protein [Acidisphaera sp.]